jgi:hypothetical protein
MFVVGLHAQSAAFFLVFRFLGQAGRLSYAWMPVGTPVLPGDVTFLNQKWPPFFPHRLGCDGITKNVKLSRG